MGTARNTEIFVKGSWQVGAAMRGLLTGHGFRYEQRRNWGQWYRYRMKEGGWQFSAAEAMQARSIWGWLRCRLLLLNQDLMHVCREFAVALTSRSSHAVSRCVELERAVNISSSFRCREHSLPVSSCHMSFHLYVKYTGFSLLLNHMVALINSPNAGWQSGQQ